MEITIEEKAEFKDINYYMSKIKILTNKYNYTIPEAIRYILPYIPNSNFKSFLERFATSIDIKRRSYTNFYIKNMKHN